MLPIRRTALKNGEMKPVETVWVRFPSLTLQRLHQRYTRIGDRRYQFEALSLHFMECLDVDADGVVLDYGDLWHSVP